MVFICILAVLLFISVADTLGSLLQSHGLPLPTSNERWWGSRLLALRLSRS